MLVNHRLGLLPIGVALSTILVVGCTNASPTEAPAADVATSWAAMDSALREAGYATTAELDGADNHIDDQTMRSDVYRGEGFEVSISILAGDPVTVLLNASAL